MDNKVGKNRPMQSRPQDRQRPIAAGADSQYANEARMAGHKIANVFPSDATFAIPASFEEREGACCCALSPLRERA